MQIAPKTLRNRRSAGSDRGPSRSTATCVTRAPLSRHGWLQRLRRPDGRPEPAGWHVGLDQHQQDNKTAKWRASCRFRDYDGMTRTYSKFGPTEVMAQKA